MAGHTTQLIDLGPKNRLSPRHNGQGFQLGGAEFATLLLMMNMVKKRRNFWVGQQLPASRQTVDSKCSIVFGIEGIEQLDGFTHLSFAALPSEPQPVCQSTFAEWLVGRHQQTFNPSGQRHGLKTRWLSRRARVDGAGFDGGFVRNGQTQFFPARSMRVRDACWVASASTTDPLLCTAVLASANAARAASKSTSEGASHCSARTTNPSAPT